MPSGQETDLFLEYLKRVSGLGDLRAVGDLLHLDTGKFLELVNFPGGGTRRRTIYPPESLEISSKKR